MKLYKTTYWRNANLFQKETVVGRIRKTFQYLVIVLNVADLKSLSIIA